LRCIAKGEPGASVRYKKIESYIPLLRICAPTPPPAPPRRLILVQPGLFIRCCCVMAVADVAGVVIWARRIGLSCAGVDRTTPLVQGRRRLYVLRALLCVVEGATPDLVILICAVVGGPGHWRGGGQLSDGRKAVGRHVHRRRMAVVHVIMTAGVQCARGRHSMIMGYRSLVASRRGESRGQVPVVHRLGALHTVGVSMNCPQLYIYLYVYWAKFSQSAVRKDVHSKVKAWAVHQNPCCDRRPRLGDSDCSTQRSEDGTCIIAIG
jgi:hypothetical protein